MTRRGILVVGDSNSAPPWIPLRSGKVRPWWQRLGDRLAGEVDGATLVQSAAIGGSQVHLSRGRTSPVPPVETHAISVLESREQTGNLPGLLIVCGGTNDLAVETTPTADLGDLALAFQILADTARDRWGIETYVISTLPMRVGGILSQAVWEQREPRRLALNQTLRTAFAPSGRFLDADTVIGEGVTGGVQIWWPYVHDALHPNAYGHMGLADALPLEHLRTLAAC